MKLLMENETKCFTESLEAHRFFEEQKKTDVWRKRYISTSSGTGETPKVVSAVECCPILIDEIRRMHGWDEGKSGAPDNETINNLMGGTQLTIRDSRGMEVPVRASALLSAFGRFGIKIESRAVREGLASDRKHLADLANTALAILGDVEATELIRDGMVTALNGPDYQILPMADLMYSLEGVLDEKFPGWEMKSATASHTFAYANYQLPGRGVVREINRILKRYGRELLPVETVVRVVLTTSDCYSSSCNLYPYITAGGKPVMIGPPIRHRHVEGNTLDKFKEECGGVYALFKDATESIEKMAGTRLRYPYEAFVKAGEAAHLPKKAVLEAAEEFELTRPISTTAYDVYMALWAIVGEAENTESLISYHEAICRLQSADWEKFEEKKTALSATA